MGKAVGGRLTSTPSKELTFAKILKRDVLYFIIMNIPSKQEMEEIRKILASENENEALAVLSGM